MYVSNVLCLRQPLVRPKDGRKGSLTYTDCRFESCLLHKPTTNTMKQRPIKFRGIITQTNEWVYGYLVVTPDGTHRIYTPPFEGCSLLTYYHVKPETVGQFTGLHDRNGKEIYEGDILCNEEYNTWQWRGVVKFSHGVFGAEWLKNVESQSMVGSWGQKHNLRKLDDDILERQVVVGNIHENPELLTQPTP
jgi:uncharacterized phage protein (TIGR01671 family)